jgi:hypothetical protein
MAKTQNKKIASLAHRKAMFSETWLVIFAMIFATIGSYSWLKTLAAPEDISYLLQSSNISAQEKAWFSTVTAASLIIVASGPIAALLLWWIWRRSAFALWAKLLLTATPLIIVMAFT